MPRQTSVETVASIRTWHTGSVQRAIDEGSARQKFLDARDTTGDPKAKREPFVLPDVPGIYGAPVRLDDAEEALLRWYFGDPAVASVARSSGSFGAQLEIASAYGYGSVPCRRCGGRWRMRRKNGRDVLVDWRDGTGLCPRDHFGKRVTYASALAAYRQKMQREHAIVLSSVPTPKPDSGVTGEQLWDSMVEAFARQGKALMTDAAFRALFDRLPEELCRPCQACGGIGVVPRRAAAHVEVTAYPTGSSKHGTTARRKDPEAAIADMNERGVVADGFGLVAMGELARYREMHEVMADVARLSPLAAVSLEEFYSAPGTRWDRLGSTRQGGQRALEALVTELYDVDGPVAARAASKLRDHQCAVYHVAAYGAAS